ncbi:hypothetical protein [Agromyces aerolatus]|uniref:hypothetical protein n=1 Tax=Agromyces sp. LY-1074 TaxID=3074080 RepID=UPI0028607170|nr:MULTISPECIES: hypothetical protein [unclassified Agromyces]MDR5698428.1 hypothetical protein [Agromyces sp. LY-1074]MDR5704722.1 hypothetical protein [Agromyces sp. LY-1358]
MARLVRRAATIAFGAFVLLAALIVSAAWSASAEPIPQPASPADVEIPYLGETSIEPAPPWRIADCAAVAAASPLVRGCDPTRITLAAGAYDPEAGTVVLEVALTNDAVSTTVGYRVRLAGPEVPTARPAATTWPVAAGSLLRLPVSELGVECAVCADGGRLEAIAVKPAEAGSVWATPTHLVFRAAAGYTGPAEVGVRFADDFGTWSAGATVHAAVYRPAAEPLVTFDLIAPVGADGTASVDLSTLAVSVAGDDVVLVGCGPAMHGRVACDGDEAVYTAVPGRVDQFSVQFAAGGEQATASVTLVPEDLAETEGEPAEGSARPGRPASGPVPIAPPDQTDGVATWIVPPAPVDHHEASGILRPLIATLDRVGAR